MVRDISDEELGIKSFHLKRDRAVEQSLDKIRHSLGKHWQELSYNDTQTLQWALGEAWSFIARDNWNNIAFSLLDINDVKKILEISEQITQHKIPGSNGLEQIHKILDSKRATSYN